jgi:hypothetical protein
VDWIPCFAFFSPFATFVVLLIFLTRRKSSSKVMQVVSIVSFCKHLCDCSIYGKLTSGFPNVWNGSEIEAIIEQLKKLHEKCAKKFKVKSKM